MDECEPLAAGHLEIDRAFLKAARKVEPTSYMSEAGAYTRQHFGLT